MGNIERAAGAVNAVYDGSGCGKESGTVSEGGRGKQRPYGDRRRSNVTTLMLSETSSSSPDA